MRNFIIGLTMGLVVGCGQRVIYESGPKGDPGEDGLSMVFSTSSASSCPNGGSVILMAQDTNRNNLFDLTDGSIMSTTICNGTNAPPTAFTPVGLLDPCGDAPGRYDEIFLKLSNGTILASFSDNVSGLNTRFSVLSPGTYQTTDGDNCIFTINALGQFTYQNHVY